ncbi:MAG: hypothetical protein JWP83_132 [Mycobacterium sp.]|uniref:WXG100-like domain-containing protein n=1 Tax=Mycobacterium sp. TaxID=1785 RepID=UPI002634E051|nr:ADP-ribosyltransferase [Mycobacterium sp.]MCW2658980.1 hypothetical protein [Mycobacterium sp.]
MVPLVVDPEALFAVGSAVIGAGDGLAANLTVLTAGVAAHTGLDAAGEVFGLAYQDSAESLLKAAAAAINACRQSGALIQQGASNYSKAEAASKLGGGADVLQAPAEPAKITAPVPPGTWGKGQPPPLLWAVVESFVDDVWPDGDVAGLHAAAARWRGFAGSAGGMRSALNAAKSLLDAHQIPEGGKIDEALSQIGTGIGQIGEASGKLATALDGFANEVDHAQNSIRDLLNRLGSLTDLGHDLMLIVKGDALDEIRKIAKDINDVLHNLGREARAAEQGVKQGLGIVDGLVVKLEKYVRRELTDFLGDAVGNQVATAFDVFVNANEGVLKGAVGMALSIGDLDPRWFLVDPHGAAETWAGLGKGLWKGSLFNAVINPQEAGEANWQQLKSLLHLDDWSTARPGLGFGENVFDGAMLFIPGEGEVGGAAEAGGVAAQGAEAAVDAERAAARAADGIAGVAGPRGALADITGTGSSLTKDLEGVTGNLPEIEPSLSGQPVALPPKAPEAPVGPAPRAPDTAPGTPESPAPAPEPDSPEPRGAGGQPAPAGGSPHDPAGGPPASGPVSAGGGAHDPVSAPGAPPAPAHAAGPHEPLETPAAPAPTAGGPHGAPSAPVEAPAAPAGAGMAGPHESAPAPPTATHEPTLAPAAGPHDPVSAPVEGSHEPTLAPVGGPHDAGPPAVDTPHEPASPPVGALHESVPASVERPHQPASAEGPHEPASVPPEGPHEPVTAPAEGAHESPSVPAAVSSLAPVPAAAGERVPSTIPQLTDHSPARAPAAATGSEPEPVAAHPSVAAPPAKSVPHAPAAGGRPTGMPIPGGSPRGAGDGGPPGEPKPPHSNRPPGPGDRRDPLGGREAKLPPQHAKPHEPGDKGGEHDGPADGGDHPSLSDPLRPHDLSALANYTGFGFRDLNDALRSNAVDASHHARIEAIKNALQKLPTYRGPVVRGTDLSPDVLAQYRPGEVITEKAFVSTTTNPAVARSTAFSGNVEFRIVSFTGRDVSSVSMFPGEREILFPPGTHFFVAGKTIDPLTGKTIIEMIER